MVNQAYESSQQAYMYVLQQEDLNNSTVAVHATTYQGESSSKDQCIMSGHEGL